MARTGSALRSCASPCARSMALGSCSSGRPGGPTYGASGSGGPLPAAYTSSARTATATFVPGSPPYGTMTSAQRGVLLGSSAAAGSLRTRRVMLARALLGMVMRMTTSLVLASTPIGTITAWRAPEAIVTSIIAPGSLPRPGGASISNTSTRLSSSRFTCSAASTATSSSNAAGRPSVLMSAATRATSSSGTPAVWRAATTTAGSTSSTETKWPMVAGAVIPMAATPTSPKNAAARSSSVGSASTASSSSASPAPPPNAREKSGSRPFRGGPTAAPLPADRAHTSRLYLRRRAMDRRM